MNDFYNVLSSEIFKTRRNWNFTISLSLPALVTLIVFMSFTSELNDINYEEGINYWQYYSSKIFGFYQLLYPLFVAIICFSICNIEHRCNGFRQLFTLPYSKYYFYLVKILILIFWIMCSLIVACSLLLLGGNLLSIMYPHLGFQDFDISLSIVAFFVRTFGTLVTIMSVQLLLSLRWDNFIVPITFACFMIVFGSIVADWKYSYLIPFCNISTSFRDFYLNSTVVLNRIFYINTAYFILFSTGGYLLLLKKKV